MELSRVFLKTILKTAAAVLLCGASAFGQARYDTAGRMLRPDNYREWIYLSSGLGMSYDPPAPGQAVAAGANPFFDNVFVDPAAWRAFKQTGKWPDKTVMVLELRASSDKGSIIQRGRFQTTAPRIEVHVKDAKRFSGGWAFFGFSAADTVSQMTPTDKDCYSCHREHGTLDTTFAQFYPTVREIAERKGTLPAPAPAEK